MIDKFLKAKHWHLFLLMVGIPMLFQLITMGIVITRLANNAHSAVNFNLTILKAFPFFILITTGVFFGWFWSVVTGLHKKIPAEAQFKLGRFKILFFIPLIYLVLLCIGMGIIINIHLNGAFTPSPTFMSVFVLLVFPLHLISVFCIFHSIYYAAKTYKTVQLQHKADFSDFAGEFFLFWFFPVGVWLLQPKINKMAETV